MSDNFADQYLWLLSLLINFKCSLIQHRYLLLSETWRMFKNHETLISGSVKHRRQITMMENEVHSTRARNWKLLIT